uniref:Uncharacterized protein n=1 Tax=Arundo donax TaxID=35708 RepID=A0A0A8Y5M7_ARUDO
MLTRSANMYEWTVKQFSSKKNKAATSWFVSSQCTLASKVAAGNGMLSCSSHQKIITNAYTGGDKKDIRHHRK